MPEGFGVKISLFGDWSKAKSLLGTMQQKFEQAAERAMLQEAHMLRGEIVKGIREGAPGGQAFEKLAESTLAVRAFKGFRGTKPLIHRGDLRNSIIVKRTTNGVFIGILYSAKTKDGKGVANIASMMENGAGPIVVPITDKSRKFFHAALAKAGLSPEGKGHGGGHAIAIIRIPPRPFMRPIFDKFAKPEDVRQRFYERIVTIFGDAGG